MSESQPAPSYSPKSVFFWTLCVSFLILCLISGALFFLGPRMYRSEAIVEFSPDKTNYIVMGEPLRQQLLVEMEVINSPELQRQVIKELDLDAVWGKKYNNGEKFSSEDSLSTLKSRMDLQCRQGSRQISIIVYSDDPAEPARIANSLALNYCVRFTTQRGISTRMLTAARAPAAAVHLILEIPKAIIRSFILALLVACVAWGIAITRAKMLRMPPPVPSNESTPRRFQKY